MIKKVETDERIDMTKGGYTVSYRQYGRQVPLSAIYKTKKEADLQVKNLRTFFNELNPFSQTKGERITNVRSKKLKIPSKRKRFTNKIGSFMGRNPTWDLLSRRTYSKITPLPKHMKKGRK